MEIKAYRAQQAAKVLNISESTLQRLLRSGKLESLKVGRARLISAAAIDRFLAGEGAGK